MLEDLAKLYINLQKKNNKKVKRKFSKGEFPYRTDMNLKKLKKMIKL